MNQLDKIELMLKWIIWKLRDGEHIKELEHAPYGMDEDGKKLHLTYLNHEPNIHAIYEEIVGKKHNGREKNG